ncbi:DNA helicase-2/ATP-dependent DNA helicase PcrA [Arthrobacter sp. UYEF21]
MTELSLMVVAPAGCGKTEALALRVAGILARGQVSSPRRVLVVTFSKKARDNIRERLADYVDARTLREKVTIANLHGLAARIIRSHGNVIGISPDVLMPDSDWVAAECRALRLGYDRTDEVRSVLQRVKLQSLNDDEVLEMIRALGDPIAETIETKRQQERRLTYEDLPRLAELVLQSPWVAEIYNQHFGCVVVDEFQDLTLQQLRMLKSIGSDRITFAGDLAQGIYTFAGAAPSAVHESIRGDSKAQISFAESHRSSPSVLDLVNVLRDQTGGEELVCAKPERWTSGGLGAVQSFADVEKEAEWVSRFARYVLKRAPQHRVGVIARTVGRRRFVDELMRVGDLPWHRWDDPLLDRETAIVTQRILSKLKLEQWESAENPIQYLLSMGDAGTIQDPDASKSLREAMEWAHDELVRGTEIEELRGRVKIGDRSAFTTSPGVHLLSGHAGKGQQFDWVCVVGAEEGVLPFFKAKSSEELAEEARTLSVMISRARHGALVLHAKSVPDNSGRVRGKEESRYSRQLRASPSCLTGADLVSWLSNADWAAIAAS